MAKQTSCLPSTSALAENAAGLIALAADRTVNGESLASAVSDTSRLEKLARYTGHIEEKVFARDFCKMVLAMRAVADASPLTLAPPSKVTPVTVPPASGRPGSSTDGDAADGALDSRIPLDTLPVVCTTMVAFQQPTLGVEKIDQLRYRVGLLWRTQRDNYVFWMLRIAERALLWGPVLAFAFLSWGFIVTLVCCVALPDLPVRFLAALCRLVPQYLSYAGNRVSSAIVEELSSSLGGITESSKELLQFEQMVRSGGNVTVVTATQPDSIWADLLKLGYVAIGALVVKAVGMGGATNVAV